MEESFFWENKDKRILKLNLLSDMAQEFAETVHDEATPKSNKYTQIRKFFDEVIAHKTFLLGKAEEERSEVFKQRLPYIKMINAKLAYSKARDYLGNKCFSTLETCINEIKDIDDFYAFAVFFEAFIAFYRQYKDRESSKNGEKTWQRQGNAPHFYNRDNRRR